MTRQSPGPQPREGSSQDLPVNPRFSRSGALGLQVPETRRETGKKRLGKREGEGDREIERGSGR